MAPRLLVLAGGRASRLGTASDDTPKFLVPINDKKRFADVQLAWIAKHGFSDVILSVGYRGDQIRSYCGDGTRFGLRLRYVDDGPTPLGTGGAVRKALIEEPGRSCVMYGDTILDFDVKAVLALNPRAHALMTVMVCPPSSRPNAKLEGDKVRYDKRAPEDAWTYIDYGFLVVSEPFVHELPETGDLADSLTQASRSGRLLGYETKEPFWEINTAESLEAFRRKFG